MTPEEILSFPARVLTQAQREHYFEHGYVGVESLVPPDTLSELQAVTTIFSTRAARKLLPAKFSTSALAIAPTNQCCDV